MGGVADDISRFISREEYRPGIAQTDDVAQLRGPDTSKAGIVQPVLQTGHGDDGLWFEGRGALHQVLRLSHVKG